jgi:hypothetical protein
VSSGVSESCGRGFTITIICDDAVHPAKSPITVYIVEAEGEAVTLDELVVFNDEEGLHKYEFAPVALNIDVCPLQMVSSGDTNRTGSGLTVSVTCAVAVQPSELPVTV